MTIPHHSWTEDSALNCGWFAPQRTAAEVDEKNRRALILHGTQLLSRIGIAWLRGEVDLRAVEQFNTICVQLACGCNVVVGGYRYCAVHGRTS